jgi:predicted transcriptional regulator of viral defense system
MKQSIIDVFRQNGGILTSKDLLTPALRYHIQEMVRSGIITRVRQGIYILNNENFDINPQLLFQTMIPNGVFCLYTAWDYFELTTYTSSEYHIAVPRDIKVHLPEPYFAKIYHWSTDQYQLGITKVPIDGEEVNMYNIEKSVCDAVKFRNKIGHDLSIEILKNYLQRSERNLDLLMKYAKVVRIGEIIRILVSTII